MTNENLEFNLTNFIKNNKYTIMKRNSKNLETFKEILKFLDDLDCEISKETLVYLIKNNEFLNKLLNVIVFDNLKDIKNGNVDHIYINLTSSFMIEEYAKLNDIDISYEIDESFFEVGDSNYIEGDPVKVYLMEIGKYKLLEKEEQKDLLLKIKSGDEKAKEKFVNHNLRLVVSIAKRYTYKGVEFLDLIQEGSLGLLKAIDKYDIESGFAFSTYATWWIRQTVTRALAEKSKSIRLPVHIVEKLNKYKNALVELESKYGRIPTSEELAKYLNLSVEKIIELEQIRIDYDSVASLNVKIGDKEDEELEYFIQDSSENVQDELERKILNKELLKILRKYLNDRELVIIIKRYGLDGEEPLTLEELGSMFNITRERIRQIEAKAEKRLSRLKDIKKFKIYLGDLEQIDDEITTKKSDKSKEKVVVSKIKPMSKQTESIAPIKIKKDESIKEETKLISKNSKNDENIDKSWRRKYEYAKKYYEEHGDLLIQSKYKIKEKDGKEISLGKWIEYNRKLYKEEKLDEAQIDMLNNIGMVWSIGKGKNQKNNYKPISEEWYRNYELAKAYYEEYGDLLIPRSYTVTYKDGNKIHLGNWVARQRGCYNGTDKVKLKQIQIDMLNNIEMVWDNSQMVEIDGETIGERWVHNYKLAKKYYEDHKDLLIPVSYKVKDENGKEISLGKWIHFQRGCYNGTEKRKLKQIQIDMLNKIGMVWNLGKGNNPNSHKKKGSGNSMPKKAKLIYELPSLKEYSKKEIDNAIKLLKDKDRNLIEKRYFSDEEVSLKEENRIRQVIIRQIRENILKINTQEEKDKPLKEIKKDLINTVSEITLETERPNIPDLNTSRKDDIKENAYLNIFGSKKMFEELTKNSSLDTTIILSMFFGQFNNKYFSIEEIASTFGFEEEYVMNTIENIVKGYKLKIDNYLDSFIEKTKDPTYKLN